MNQGATTTRAVARSSILALGVLVAALMATMLLLATKPVHAATTFTVNSTSDLGDVFLANDVCDASPLPGRQCTLKAAIQEANDTPGADTINFNIPGSGVKTIKPMSYLPVIYEQVTIDGYTQPGSSPNTMTVGTNAVLKIELNGTNAGSYADGLDIYAPNSVVKGLVINRFDYDGIYIVGPGNKVEGNFIGTDPSGAMDLGNSVGGVDISYESINSTVGGSSPAARNLISGNDGDGVAFVYGEGNQVLGNLIGTKKDGTGPLGNSNSGVYISFESINNTVGGTSAGAANTIAFNGKDGVAISGAGVTGNRVLLNSIFSNAEQGIDLNNDGPTANDPGDADTGPNNLQNKPAITSASTSASSTTVQGTLNSTPNKTFTVRLFSSPSGTGDQGKKFIGQTSVTTNSNGNVSFTFSPDDKVEVGRRMTATATDSGGNTSEFSAAKTVVVQ